VTSLSAIIEFTSHLGIARPTNISIDLVSRLTFYFYLQSQQLLFPIANNFVSLNHFSIFYLPIISSISRLLILPITANSDNHCSTLTTRQLSSSAYLAPFVFNWIHQSSSLSNQWAQFPNLQCPFPSTSTFSCPMNSTRLTDWIVRWENLNFTKDFEIFVFPYHRDSFCCRGLMIARWLILKVRGIALVLDDNQIINLYVSRWLRV
jgi:hypothetical protein